MDKRQEEVMPINKDARRYYGGKKMPTEPEFYNVPEGRLAEAAEIAKRLKQVILDEEMWAPVQGKKHVMVEGWGVLFTMLGFTPRIVSVAKLDDGEGWLVRGELRDSRGETISSAYASCGDAKDKPWTSRSVAAQISMAETRCVGKMGRTIGGHIVKLAGYTATPAEEMPADEGKSSFQERTETPVVMPPKK